MNVTKSGKTLTIDGRTVVLDQRVEAMVVLDDLVIVELYVNDFKMGDPLVGRNVIALDVDGNLVWRIPDTGVMIRDPDGSEAPEAYYTLRLNSDGKTINIGTPVMTYEIDPETGRISKGIVNR